MERSLSASVLERISLHGEGARLRKGRMVGGKKESVARGEERSKGGRKGDQPLPIVADCLCAGDSNTEPGCLELSLSFHLCLH